jgi:hypothetical protein
MATGNKVTTFPYCGGDRSESWKEVLFWVDKCCIPQGHPLIKEYFSRLEDFLRRSDGMVVLLTWEYFSRLWCIYEWASFLVYHPAKDVDICADFFLKPATQSLYLRCIANFSVAKANCDVESDRVILQAKILQHFVSVDAFELFAKSTAVALLAKTAARRGGRNQSDYESEFVPWIDLAVELDLIGLADALKTACPIAWRSSARAWLDPHHDCIGKAARAWLEDLDALIEAWFDRHVAPELLKIKARCVQPEFLSEEDLAQIATTRQRNASMEVNSESPATATSLAERCTASLTATAVNVKESKRALLAAKLKRMFGPTCIRKKTGAASPRHKEDITSYCVSLLS